MTIKITTYTLFIVFLLSNYALAQVTPKDKAKDIQAEAISRRQRAKQEINQLITSKVRKKALEEAGNKALAKEGNNRFFFTPGLGQYQRRLSSEQKPTALP